MLFKLMKHLAKVSMLLNVAVVLFYSLNYAISKTRVIASDFESKMSEELLVRSNSNQESIPVQDSYKETCSKSKNMLLFGMKQHWFDFCRFTGMEHIRYLVEFPREISCPLISCSARLHYSEEPIHFKGADVVAFSNVYHWISPDKWKWAHGNRTESQAWVMISMDSPLYVPGFQPPGEYKEQTYNWIASYKLDSDVYLPYGFYMANQENDKSDIDLQQFVDGKDKLVAWMSSNCETIQWDRHKFVNDLKGIIPVDKYGKCGDHEVPWNDDKSIKNVLGRYKFYLSLENSCCDDYITEKFWRALDMGVVPVVVGASYDQYLKVAPPNSFIHVDQFDSINELAAHLQLLNTNDVQYKEYFKWRNEGTVKTHSLEEQYITPLMNSTFCSILEKYVKTKPEDRRNFIKYQDHQWLGSCRECGSKWIKSYMKPG